MSRKIKDVALSVYAEEEGMVYLVAEEDEEEVCQLGFAASEVRELITTLEEALRSLDPN